jgi:hypothetical protein
LLRGFIAGDLIFGVVMIAIWSRLLSGAWACCQFSRGKNAQLLRHRSWMYDVRLCRPTLLLKIILTMTVTADPLIVVDTPTRLNKCDCEYLRGGARLCSNFSGWEVAFEGRFALGETKVFEAKSSCSADGNAAALQSHIMNVILV